MGLILSRFRRKKTPDEILEEIQSDIQSLESDRNQVLQRQNYVVGRLIIYSVVLYVIAAALFYFCFFPASLTDRIFYMIPLLMFPLLIVLLKKFITWYYKREIIHNKDKLSDLKAKKKKILEDVMNTETYKVAKEILEKYAPEQLKKSGPEPIVKPLASSGTNLKVPVPKDPQNSPPGPTPPQQLQVPKLPALPAPQPAGFSPVHQKTMAPMILQRRQSSPQRLSLLEGSPQRRLVRPIIPRERNWIDRIIESIVGDGPSNRYALICKNCSSHNGMALREEFEYLAFRCAYCGFPNPSHKVKPAPSRPSSRSSSVERKVDNVVKEQLEDSEILQKDKEDEKKMDISLKDEKKMDITLEDNKESAVATSQNPLGDSEEDATKSDAESDESSNRSNGVRPRKPLHVTD